MNEAYRGMTKDEWTALFIAGVEEEEGAPTGDAYRASLSKQALREYDNARIEATPEYLGKLYVRARADELAADAEQHRKEVARQRRLNRRSKQPA